MASQCLFQGERRDVLALIARVEASGPPTKDPATNIVDNWDSLAADLAASYFTGDVLRWYEGLGDAAQESWVSLRASLSAKFVTDNGASSNEESDRGHRNSCLAAWPAPPPLSVPRSRVGQPDSVVPSEELQTPELPLNAVGIRSSRTILAINNNIRKLRKQANGAARITTTTATASSSTKQLVGWKPIEVELPLSGQTEPTTYRISKSIPLRPGQLTYLRIGFRLVGRPAPHEQTRIRISYKKKSSSPSTSYVNDWRPNPLRLLPDTVFAYVGSRTWFSSQLPPGVLIHSSFTMEPLKSSSVLERPQVLVEWKFGDRKLWA
ncbi:hypothetical protein M407DRAFT_10411 [Tulasnella calospora MUT 4182]|uniref:Uncharacterized protein n=1 Tax=Tulasnella calospora MUT 4182 TaxID=1051891 RepID=A0A0C3LJ24_9AGAM|nr:hypothetical protein M407DRAFT_10411 [Tulasnella calospora MUT 4182]